MSKLIYAPGDGFLITNAYGSVRFDRVIFIGTVENYRDKDKTDIAIGTDKEKIIDNTTGKSLFGITPGFTTTKVINLEWFSENEAELKYRRLIRELRIKNTKLLNKTEKAYRPFPGDVLLLSPKKEAAKSRIETYGELWKVTQVQLNRFCVVPLDSRKKAFSWIDLDDDLFFAHSLHKIERTK